MRRSARVALVSLDPVWKDRTGGLVAFTYSVHKLAASLRACPDLDDVEVRVIDLPESDPEAFLEALLDFRPTLVAASLYLWSIGPFRDLAARLKRADPTVQLVVGGPHARASVFALAPYASLARHVDAAVTGEGEEILRAIVRQHQDPGWTRMPGLLVPHALGWRSTGPLPRVDVDAYPSPYQLDLAPPGPMGYLETFRGCPIHCTFCQWGEQAADRVFSVEHLASHLEGLRRAKVDNVYFLDAALNLSPRGFRNLAAAERETGVLAELLVRAHIYPTILREEHLELMRAFGRCDLTIGVQSFDADVLARLGRPFDLGRFERVIEAVRAHWPIQIELILGLPGDSPASFRETFHRALEMADVLRVFWALVLPDALLDRAPPEDRVAFDPETWLVTSCDGWTPEALRAELDYVASVAAKHENAYVAEHWAGFHVRRARAMPDEPARRLAPEDERAVPLELVEAFRRRVAALGGRGAWRLEGVRTDPESLFFDLTAPGGPVVLAAAVAAEGQRSFHLRDGVAYSHRGPLPREAASGLREVIEALHPDAIAYVPRG